MVTGGGKTYFALQCMLDGSRAMPDIRTIIVVPTIALLDQWYVSLQDDLGVDPREIALFSGENRAKTPSRINVMVINTARARIQNVIAKAPTLLIVDECHHAASEVNSLALIGDHVMTLGLSATPERDYDDLFLEVIQPALGPIIYEYDYNQALRDGVIAPLAAQTFASHSRSPKNLPTRNSPQDRAVVQEAAEGGGGRRTATTSLDHACKS